MIYKKKILLIEDEVNLRKTIELNLQLEGFEVTAIEKAPHILQILSEEHFDLIILDIMLPELDGIRICELIRAQNRQIQILMLSAKSTSKERVLGLQTGANDYMVKPFELAELLFRIQKLLQPTLSHPHHQSIFEFGENKIDVDRLEAINFNQQKITITKKEALFLKLLLENPNEIQTREKILNRIWGYDIYPNTRTIDNFILKFRKYFEKNPSQPIYFISKRGIGYIFVLKK